MRSLALLAGALFAAWSPQIVTGAEETSGRLRDIRRSWRNQHIAVRAGKFKLRGRQSYATHERRSLFDGPASYREDDVEAKETAFVSSDYTVDVSFMGGMGAARIVTNRPLYAAKTKRFLKSSSDVAFDGNNQSRSLMKQEGLAAPMGVIHPPQTGNNDIRVVGYAPLMLAFRSGDPTLVSKTVSAYREDEFTEAETQLQAREMIKLVDDRSKGELWLEDSFPFALRRYVVRSQERPFRLVNISRVDKKGDLWIPMAWTCTYYDYKGRLDSRTELTVIDYELNPKLSVADFQLSFPEGAVVRDER